MLAILAVTNVLASCSTSHVVVLLWHCQRLYCFSRCISWEAFGFFTALILAVELWKFWQPENRTTFKEIRLWLLMFIPWLFLASPAYPQWLRDSPPTSLSTAHSAIIVLLIRSIRYLLLIFQTTPPVCTAHRCF